MTQLLERAFEKASKLPDDVQDSLATLMLEELDSERYWDKVFASSPEVLSSLAAEALAEHRAGKTKPLDPRDL